MAPLASPEQRVALLGTVQVLHEHLTTSLCQTVFQQTRTTERERRWRLAAWASFWTAVLLRAPQALPQALWPSAPVPRRAHCLGRRRPWRPSPQAPCWSGSAWPALGRSGRPGRLGGWPDGVGATGARVGAGGVSWRRRGARGAPPGPP